MNSIFVLLDGYKLQLVQYGATFLRFCRDLGTSQSGIVINQVCSHRQPTSYATDTYKPATIFRVGTTLSKSKGKITPRLPLASGQVICFDTDIIDADITLFLSLDVMRTHGSIIDLSKGIITSNNHSWKSPTHYNQGHVFIMLTRSIFHKTTTNRFAPTLLLTYHWQTFSHSTMHRYNKNYYRRQEYDFQNYCRLRRRSTV